MDAETRRPGHLLTRWVFLRGLGAVYAVAFVSLLAQVDGLVGSGGILPAEGTIEAWDALADHRGLGVLRFAKLPTLCWIGAGDTALAVLAGGGLLLSLLLVAGVAPLATLSLLWLFYLSLASVCSPFLDFQWDALLLETGFLALFLAPTGWRPGLARERAPTRAGVWLMRWLLFHLMFASGVTKLASGDVAWRELTALQFHYASQPLPTWTSWYLHHAPTWFHTFTAFFTLALEVAVPWLVFAPRKWRFVGLCSMVSFQLLILATGNFGFFNLLAILLCVTLLDDGYVPTALRRFDTLRSEIAQRKRSVFPTIQLTIHPP